MRTRVANTLIGEVLDARIARERLGDLRPYRYALRGVTVGQHPETIDDAEPAALLSVRHASQ
jgi:hypothetical protein